MSVRKEYSTKTRSEILDFIKNNSAKTVSASEIMQHLKDIGSPVNQTTVYRYLNKLCEQQKVIKYPDKSGDKSVYQYYDEDCNCDNHLHLRCTECGKLIHLDCSFIDELSNHLEKNHDFHIQYKGNMLYGICKDCENKDKKKNTGTK